MTTPADDGEATDVHTRRSWRIAWMGTLLLGGGLAAASALSGGSGSEGLLLVVVGALLSCLAGTLHAVFTGALDTYRDEHVGRGRVVAAAVLGALSFVFVLVAVGLAA